MVTGGLHVNVVCVHHLMYNVFVSSGETDVCLLSCLGFYLFSAMGLWREAAQIWVCGDRPHSFGIVARGRTAMGLWRETAQLWALFSPLKVKQDHPVSHKFQSLSTSHAAFDAHPANFYYHVIELYQTTACIV